MTQQAQPPKGFCGECGNEVNPKAFVCTHCGVLLAKPTDSTRPALALALSFFFPGAGQLMYGQTVPGVLLLVFTVITLYIGWFITMPIAVGMTANRAFQQRLIPL